MKRFFKSMLVVAAAATTLIGCSKDATETPASAGDFTLNLVTGSDTRTEIYDLPDNGGVNIRWSKGDVAEVFINTYWTKAEAQITDDIATFSGKLGNKLTTAGLYKVQGFYPAAAYAATANQDEKVITAMGLKLPAAQSATTASFDKNADIMVAKNMDVEITDADIAAREKTVDNFTFGRTTAITRIGFKVTNAELTAGDETVKSIAFAVEGKSLAGTFAFDPAAFEYIASTTDLTPVADRNNLFYDAADSEVTVTLTDTPALKEGFNAWISTAPITLAAGDKLTFTVTTSTGKKITKTAEVKKEATFLTTRLNTLNVTLGDDVMIDTPAVADGTATLTNADIVAQAASQAYANPAVTLTATDGSVWGFKGYRTQTGNFLQMKNADDAHIALPTVNAPIQKIVLTVGDTNQKNAAGGGNTRTYYFRSALNGENIATGTGDSTVELDLTDKGDFYTGYIQVSGATRVFDVTVYCASGSSSDPQIVAQDITAPAKAGDYTAAYSLVNSTETVEVSAVDGTVVTEAIADGGELLYTVADNYTAEAKEGSITLTAGTLTKVIKVTQQASALEVSTEAIVIAADATTATFTVTSADFDWFITVPEGGLLTADPELEAASDKAVTVTVTYTGTATGEIGQLTVWRTDNDPQQKTVTVSKQASVAQGDKEVSFVFSEMGYANETEVTSAEKAPIAIAFDAGTKYYDSGTALRVYAGKTFTISGDNATITKIEFTFDTSNSKGKNAMTADPTGYVETDNKEAGTWIGSASSVTFTIDGTSGHKRIQSIKITYDGAAADERVKLATPEVTATQDGKSVTLSWGGVTNATGYEYTVGTVNDLTFDTSVTVPMTEGTYDWTVTAVADDETKYLPSDPATGSITVKAPVVGGDEITITLPLGTNIFDLSSNKANDAANEISKTYEGYTYYLKASETCYFYSSKALFIGKANSYITFPAIPEYRLASVKASNATGASAKGKIAVYPTDTATAIAGGEAQSIAGGSSATWTLTGSEANTAYRLYITNAYNVQYTEIVLTYTK